MEPSLEGVGLNPEEGFNLKHGTFITSLNVEDGSNKNSNQLSDASLVQKHDGSIATKSSTRVIENLYSQIDQLTNNNFHLTNQNQELLKQLNVMSEQISKLNRANDMSRNEITAKDLNIKKLQKQIMSQEYQLEKFEKDYDFLRTEFLEKAKVYQDENVTLSDELQNLKITVQDLVTNDPLKRNMKEYDQRFNSMDSSFHELKFKLIQQLDDLKLENTINIEKLNNFYDNANTLLTEFEGENDKKREFLREKMPQLDRDMYRINEKQRHLEDTVLQLERNNTNASRNLRANNRNKRASVYDNNANVFARNSSTSPYLNSRRNSKFYGNQVETFAAEPSSKAHSPKLNGNSLSSKRKSFFMDDKSQATVGLGIESTRTSNMFTDQTLVGTSGPSLPGLKRGGSIRR